MPWYNRISTIIQLIAKLTSMYRKIAILHTAEGSDYNELFL